MLSPILTSLHWQWQVLQQVSMAINTEILCLWNKEVKNGVITTWYCSLSGHKGGTEFRGKKPHKNISKNKEIKQLHWPHIQKVTNKESDRKQKNASYHKKLVALKENRSQYHGLRFSKIPVQSVYCTFCTYNKIKELTKDTFH